MFLEDEDPVDHFEEDDNDNEETHHFSTFPSQASPPMPRSGTAQPMLATREVDMVAILQEHQGLLHKLIEGQKALEERTAALENKMAEITCLQHHHEAMMEKRMAKGRGLSAVNYR